MAASAILSALPIGSFLLNHVRGPSLFSRGSSIKKAEFSSRAKEEDVNRIRITSERNTEDLTMERKLEVNDTALLLELSGTERIRKKKNKRVGEG